MGWESFDVVRFELGSLLQSHMKIVKLETAFNSLAIGLRILDVKPNYRPSWTGSLPMWLDFTLALFPQVKPGLSNL